MENMLPIYIAIFIPILLMILSQHKTLMYMIVKKKRRGFNAMDDILNKCVGKKCTISTGSMGVHVDGVVKQVTDRWVEVETRNRTEVLSVDFIQHIRIKKDR